MDIPPNILDSAIYGSGGFVVIPDLFSSSVLSQLEADARDVRATGGRSALANSAADEDRGGSPARAFSSANSVVIQWQVFSAPSLLASLSRVAGLEIVPTGGGSYTYYEQPGDFLALHRDIVTCDLALITCLSESGSQSEGGGLVVYPGCETRPLSAARAATAMKVPLRPGETVLLLGGIVPHEVTPMQPGQERIVSLMCYRTAF